MENQTVTLDFKQPAITKLIFTNSRDEADKLTGLGYVIYFPSELVEIEIKEPIFVWVIIRIFRLSSIIPNKSSPFVSGRKAGRYSRKFPSAICE